MKNLIIAIFSLTLLCGCGHNIIHVDRGNGFVLRVPIYGEYNLLEFRCGNIDSATAILRGGSSYDYVSSSGGSTIGTSGTSGKIFFNSVSQLNEGYLVKVLTDENVSPEIKKIIVEKYLLMVKPPIASDSKSVSIGSTVETGEKSNNFDLNFSGMDNAISKLTETNPGVVKDIANATKETAVKITETIDVAPEIVESTKNIKNIAIALFCVFVVALIIAIVMSFRRRWRQD